MGRDAQGPRKARSKQAGTSLIEALLATVLLALGTLTALQISSQAVRGSRAALQRVRAIELASELAERLQADPTTDLAAWQSEAAAVLMPGSAARVAGDVARVQLLPASQGAPARWRIQLHWIDAADGADASHVALLQRQEQT
jgi:type IV pilus modification protein PilV